MLDAALLRPRCCCLMADLAYRKAATAIRRQRRYLDWTQRDLAERAGVSRATVQRLEAGEEVTASMLLAVVGALDLDLTEIFRDGVAA